MEPYPHRMTNPRPVAPALTAIVVGLAAIATTASAAAAPARTCHGLPVTVAAGAGTVVGTSGRDVIALTGPATVHAGRGNDVICGSAANDVVYAGPGDDLVVGRGGHDRLEGGAGRDSLFGEQGHDHLVGGPGSDTLMGGSGHDRVDRAGRTGATEQQPTDSVLPGTSAVSLSVTPPALEQLRAADYEIGTYWPLGHDGQSVMWATFAPQMVNSIWLNGPFQAYWMRGTQAAAVPGATIQPAATTPTALGQGQVIQWAEGFSSSPGAPGTMSLTSFADTPLVAGWARQVAVNGVRGPFAPLNAVPFPSYALPGLPPIADYDSTTAPTLSVITAAQLQRVTLAALPATPGQAGTVVGGVPLGPSITVTTGGRTEVAAVSYSVPRGFGTDS